MGTIITGSAVCTDMTDSSIELSVAAGERCIKNAGIDPRTVDLLINIGVYRDDNIMEPAIAPLVQKRLGLNNDPCGGDLNVRTFSFDLLNGACGFLNAVQVADASLRCGMAANVLILSSDVHPSKSVNETFPFKHIGAAVLLSYDPNGDRGFRDIIYRTAANGSGGFSAYADTIKYGTAGRSSLTFVTDEDYLERLGDMAADTVREYIYSKRIDPSGVKFLVTTQQGKGLAEKIYRAAGLNGSGRAIDLHDEFGDTHTSSLSLGFHTIASGGLVQERDQVLFVAAGSGLTSACAAYVI
ncbi:MAG: hypothetical protein JXA07_12415 [Spirochaetes bacterium]|nr:hypothetical protein [Spirochaetota bacterium]